MAALILGAACSSSSGPLEASDADSRAELRGEISLADVQDLIAQDDASYASPDDQVEAIQQFAKGWGACRDVFGVYVDLLRTGELEDRPVVRRAEEEIEGTSEEIERFIDQLYSPLVEGDLALAQQNLTSDQLCGFVPVNDDGSRTETIAEAVGADVASDP